MKNRNDMKECIECIFKEEYITVYKNECFISKKCNNIDAVIDFKNNYYNIISNEDANLILVNRNGNCNFLKNKEYSISKNN